MDPAELARLMVILRGHIDRGKIDVGRTQEQIDDVKDRATQSVWNALAPPGKPIPTVVFPSTKEAAKEHVVGCSTIALGERTDEPDNRIGLCQWGCGRTIQWRPYLPDHITKVCLYCMVDRLERGDQ